MGNKNEQMNIPHFDMLWISYQGDEENEYSLVIPHCEVANGEVLRVHADGVELRTAKDESVTVSHEEFKNHIEKTLNDCNMSQGFTRKRIGALCIQIKETNKVIHLSV